MKTIVPFFIVVVLIAAVASYCTARWSNCCINRPESYAAEPHEWLHEQLKLTTEQHRALEPIEQSYTARRVVIVEHLRDANRDLGRVLSQEKSYSPAVAEAVEKIHMAQGDLQKATLEHVFKMRQVLTPEQGEKLLALAQKALEDCP